MYVLYLHSGQISSCLAYNFWPNPNSWLSTSVLLLEASKVTWRFAKGNTYLLESDGKIHEPLRRHQVLPPTSLVQNSSFIYQRPKTGGPPPPVRSNFLLKSLFFSGFGFTRASGGRAAPGWVQKALERPWAPSASSPKGVGSPSPFPTHFRNTQTKDIRIFGPRKACVRKGFPKTSTQTKFDSQQQRNQMRTNEESDSGLGTMVPPGCQRKRGVGAPVRVKN